LQFVRRAFALLAGVVVLSACGGEGEGGNGGSGFQRAIEPQAQEQAESMLLTLSDFPDGWRTGAPAEQDVEGEAAFRECAGVDYSAFTIIGEARSDDFTMGETTEASSEADVFESAEMAAAAVDEFTRGFTSDDADACMSEYLGEFDDDEVEITKAEVGELSFTPPSGVDDASAWQVAFTVEGKPGTEAAGVSVTAYVELILVRKGAEIAQIKTGDILSPFDPELREELVAAVAGRMSA
jgi:hypothetical protein